MQFLPSVNGDSGSSSNGNGHLDSFELTPRYTSPQSGHSIESQLANARAVTPDLQLRPLYNESNYVKFFNSFGLKLELNNKQLVGSCPFFTCRSVHHDSPDHFFASPGQGTWDCKYCGSRGNIYGFIRQFHAECIKSTTPQAYYDLATKRPGIPAWIFPMFHLAQNPLTSEWLLPSYSFKTREMTNLYSWKIKSNGEMQVLSAPCMKQILYGLQHVRKDHSRPFMLLEGHWDYLAAYAMFYMNGLLDRYDLAATPGDTFPKEDVPMLALRDLFHHGDNDQAGSLSYDKLCQLLGVNSINPRSLHRMAFRPGEKKGYDVRDIITSHTSPQSGEINQVNAWQDIASRYYNSPTNLAVAGAGHKPNLRMLPCENFDDIVEAYERAEIYLPDCLKDMTATLFATAGTVNLPGKPLWCFQRGPSGGAKTMLLQLISVADPQCFFMTQWTGLVSGYYRDGLGDLSLAPKIQNKCVCVEDFTPMLNSTEVEQNRIFNELREIYGGKIAKYFRNQAGMREFGKDEPVKFNMLACVTDRILKVQNTDLGERFVQIDQDTYWTEDGTLLKKGLDRSELTNAATTGLLSEMMSGKSDKLLEAKGMSWGFIEHLTDRINREPEWYKAKTQMIIDDEPYRQYLNSLGNWCAYGRSFLERTRDKSILYEQRVEYGSRLAYTFTKYAIALSLIFDEDPDTNRIKGIVRKIALDTSFGYQQGLMLILSHLPHGSSVKDMAGFISMSEAHTLNKLKDMEELGIATWTTPPIGMRNRGNQPHYYYLTQELQDTSKTLGFYREA